MCINTEVTAKDMYQIVTVWTDIVPRVYDEYPHLLAEWVLFCYYDEEDDDQVNRYVFGVTGGKNNSLSLSPWFVH